MLPRGPHIRWHAGRVLAFGLGEVSLQFGRKEIVFFYCGQILGRERML